MLIVDDDDRTRALLREMLERLAGPCQVQEAVDGDSVLAIARRTRPELVLLDIVLPGPSTSGVLVCQELCKDSRTTVVIVSGSATDSVLDACLAMGAAACASHSPLTNCDSNSKDGLWTRPSPRGATGSQVVYYDQSRLQ